MQPLRKKEQIHKTLLKRPRNAREDFDEKREFVCMKAFNLGGVRYTTNTPFPKGTTHVRRLRQLYDHRYLNMLPIGVEAFEENYDPKMPDFNALPTEAIEAFLQSNGIVPRFGQERKKLIQRAKKVWHEKVEKAPVSDMETSTA